MSATDADGLNSFNPDWLGPVICDLPPASRYIFACSGGLDSILLLHLLVPVLSGRSELLVLHVNHGLSPNADSWSAFCEQVSRTLSLPFSCHRVAIVALGDGVEAAARRARYEVFRSNLRSGDVLLQGHHCNDQAETVLLRALRGAGPEGLKAIPRFRSLGEGALFRPWLNITRQQLLDVARLLEIEWIEDESNWDERFDRNFLRLSILPRLLHRWPGAVMSLARVAKQSSRQQALLDEYLDRDLSRIRVDTPFGPALLVGELRKFGDELQQVLVRRWLQHAQIPQPPDLTLARLGTEVLECGAQQQAELSWTGYSLRRYRGALYLLLPIRGWADNGAQHVVIEPSVAAEKRILFGPWTLSFRILSEDIPIPMRDNQVLLSWPLPAQLVVGTLKRGVPVTINGDSRRTPKELFAQMGLPPWWREGWPALYLHEPEGAQRLVAAGPGLTEREFAPSQGFRPVLCVSWSRSMGCFSHDGQHHRRPDC
jgi:tRNA(Ile)-lysidine synthase